MVAPVLPPLTPPLSPMERARLTDMDRMIIDAWSHRLHGYKPQPHDLQRLYLLGKAQGAPIAPEAA